MTRTTMMTEQDLADAEALYEAGTDGEYMRSWATTLVPRLIAEVRLVRSALEAMRIERDEALADAERYRTIRSAVDESQIQIGSNAAGSIREGLSQLAPDPQKITEQTTLAELAVQHAILGCLSLTLIADMKGERAAMVQHPSGLHIGRGVTEATAIEAAFSSLRRALLPEPLKELLR